MAGRFASSQRGHKLCAVWIAAQIGDRIPETRQSLITSVDRRLDLSGQCFLCRRAIGAGGLADLSGVGHLTLRQRYDKSIRLATAGRD